MHILESLVVVDAEPRSRDLLAFGFEREGCTVHATSDAREALALAETRVPQVVVVWNETAGMPALDFVRAVRGSARAANMPLLVVGADGERATALSAGADEFAGLPVHLRDVVVLAKLLSVRRGAEIAGELDDFDGLQHLTRALFAARRSGTLILERLDRVAELMFLDGSLAFAKVGRQTGSNAFHQALLWEHARLRLRLAPAGGASPSSPAGGKRIQKSMERLLEDGARFVAEFVEVSKRVGGPAAVFRQDAKRLHEVRRQVPAEVMALVDRYDGKRALVDVVEDSPFKPFDTVMITHRLLELRAVVRKGEAAAPEARPEVQDWLLGSEGRKTPSGPVAVAPPTADLTTGEARAAQAEAAASAPIDPQRDAVQMANAIARAFAPAAPMVVHVPPPAEGSGDVTIRFERVAPEPPVPEPPAALVPVAPNTSPVAPPPAPAPSAAPPTAAPAPSAAPPPAAPAPSAAPPPAAPALSAALAPSAAASPAAPAPSAAPASSVAPPPAEPAPVVAPAPRVEAPSPVEPAPTIVVPAAAAPPVTPVAVAPAPVPENAARGAAPAAPPPASTIAVAPAPDLGIAPPALGVTEAPAVTPPVAAAAVAVAPILAPRPETAGSPQDAPASPVAAPSGDRAADPRAAAPKPASDEPARAAKPRSKSGRHRKVEAEPATGKSSAGDPHAHEPGAKASVTPADFVQGRTELPTLASPREMTGRHGKLSFDALEEEFFARESDLHRVDPVENFDDLGEVDTDAPRSPALSGWFRRGKEKDKPGPKPKPKR